MFEPQSKTGAYLNPVNHVELHVTGAGPCSGSALPPSYRDMGWKRANREGDKV